MGIMKGYYIEPIGYAKSDFKNKFGVPRQSGRVKELTAKIILTGKYNCPESVRGLEDFSHAWILFNFSLSHKKEFSPTVRPPRLGGNKRVGVFASRSPNRPNNIGLSSVKIVGIDTCAENGVTIIVSGADFIDGTPILDIKPYIPYSDCHADARGSFAEEEKNYKLNVIFDENLFSQIPKDKASVIIKCIEEDPRPAYHNDERDYKMQFSDLDVIFSVCGNVATIKEIKKI